MLTGKQYAYAKTRMTHDCELLVSLPEDLDRARVRLHVAAGDARRAANLLEHENPEGCIEAIDEAITKLRAAREPIAALVAKEGGAS